MAKKITIISFIFWGLGLLFFASADIISDQQNFIYRFHLYFDNGQLFANRDFEFKYDVIPDDFVPEMISTGRAFRGEVISGKNEILHSFRFDPQKGNSAFKKGAIAVDGPYFANAAKVNFYNDKNQLLLTLDVSGSSFCNDDGACNKDVGENYQNCPNDCPRPSPAPTYQPPGPSLWQNMLIPMLLAAAGVIIAVLVVWGIIKKRRAKSGQFPPPAPPETPPSQPLS
jgi:hypothetical protein